MKKTLKLFYFITILYGIAAISIDPLIPIISKELNIGYDKIGLILLAAYIFSLASTLLTGRLCDKKNLKVIILAGLLILFSGFTILGINFGIAMFVLAIILQKSGYGSIDSSMHSYIAKVYHNMHAPIFMKIDIMFFTGAVISPLLISLLLFTKISYRYAFLLFAGAIALLSILLFKSLKRLNLKKIISDNQKNIDSEISPVSKKEKKFNLIIISSCFAMFFSMGAMTGTSSWFTTYLSSFGISVALGAIGLSAMSVVSVISLISYLKLLKKTNEITILLFGGFFGSLFISGAALSSNIILKVVFLLLQAGCFSGFFSLLTSIATYESPKSKGSILGLIIMCAFSGSIVFQPVMGYFAQYLGSSSVIYVIISGYSLSFIFLLLLYFFLKKKYRKIKLLLPFKKKPL